MLKKKKRKKKLKNGNVIVVEEKEDWDALTLIQKVQKIGCRWQRSKTYKAPVTKKLNLDDPTDEGIKENFFYLLSIYARQMFNTMYLLHRIFSLSLILSFFLSPIIHNCLGLLYLH